MHFLHDTFMIFTERVLSSKWMPNIEHLLSADDLWCV